MTKLNAATRIAAARKLVAAFTGTDLNAVYVYLHKMEPKLALTRQGTHLAFGGLEDKYMQVLTRKLEKDGWHRRDWVGKSTYRAGPVLITVANEPDENGARKLEARVLDTKVYVRD